MSLFLHTHEWLHMEAALDLESEDLGLSLGPVSDWLVILSKQVHTLSNLKCHHM